MICHFHAIEFDITLDIAHYMYEAKLQSFRAQLLWQNLFDETLRGSNELF